MGLPPTTPNLLRFGDYEFDPQAGELFKHGFRLRLQEQPLQVLLVLLANRGHVVTREELRSRLWPGTSAGDFDHGLNNAVNRLREMLCDSAEEPRFIETLPKRGYRFIATVEISTPEAFPLSAPVPREASATAAPATIAAPAKMASRRRPWWWSAALIPLLLLAAWILRPGPRETSVQPAARVIQLTSLPGLEDSPAWSPDGALVAYVSDASGGLDIYVQRLDNGQITRLTDSEADDAQPAWSPDGSRIAFVSARARAQKRLFPLRGFGGSYQSVALENGDLWVMSRTGGFPRRLAEDAYHPAWSPDGTRLVYAAIRQGQWRLVVQDVDGRSGPQNLALGAKVAARVEPVIMQPAWSPDGRWIAFVVGRGPSQSEMFVVPAAGGNAEPLTEETVNALKPAWSPDGRWVYFSSGQDGRANLYQARFEGGVIDAPRQLLPGDPVLANPTSNVAGNRIAYSRFRRAADIWEYDISSGRMARLTSETGQEDNPRPSPDGNWLAFSSDRLGGNHLWLLDRRSGSLLQVSSVTNGNYLWSSSHWSHDGRYLFYSRPGPSLWQYDMRTRTSRIVSEGGPFCVSPDDKYLIVVLDTHTISRIELASRKKVELGRLPMGALADLELSPDGQWLAFHAHHGVDRDIWLMRVDGTDAHPLTTGKDEDAHPTWSADSRLIYFVRNHQNIYSVPPAGGEPKQVTHYSSFGITVDYPATTGDGKRLLFTRGDKLGDIYLLEHPQ